MRSRLFALSLCLTCTSALAARVTAAELTAAAVWKTDFAAAQAEAKKLNRPVVLHFHATWCGPCKKMERDVLDIPQTLKLLDAGFVAVKVDCDKNPKVQVKYGVTSMPTDIILSPDGKVLVKTEGCQDRQNYLTSITRIDAKYAAERKNIARAEAAAEDKTPAQQTPLVAQKSTPPKIASAGAATGDKLVPPPTEPKKVPELASSSNPVAVPREEKKQDLSPAIDTTGFLLAMDGYCPVTLRSTRAWKSGSSDITLEHDGLTFYFTAADKRDEFKAHPDRYAPRLLGCDPVVLAENDLAVRGSVKFGAFYEGELFLFETSDSRVKFRKDPSRYSRLQHVVKPEDVKKIASTTPAD